MKNMSDFDPYTRTDPVRDLTLAIRGLRVGERLQLPNGIVVRSTVVRSGSNNERRFAVIPPEKSSTPTERHQALVLGYSAYRKAEEAARKILEDI